MRDEVVRRRRWLTEQEFLDLVGATNLIPGPNSTELAIHIGHARAGARGLLVAGLCFILPAVAIVLVAAWAYVRFGALPEVQGLLYGVKPVIIAVVAQALWALGRVALRSQKLVVLGAACALGAAAGVDELVVLAAAALAGTASYAAARHSRISLWWLTCLVGAGLSGLSTPAAARVLLAGVVPVGSASVSLATLFGVFFKAGAVLFGSGYVLLAFLRADLVDRLGWLTQAELLSAIAIGQVTPGPVFTTATFIGYVLAGPPGAAIATAGIFLPAFIYVAATAPIVPRLRRSPLAARVLDGVNAASLALMLVVTVQLARTAVVDPLTVTVALASLVLLLTTNVNSAWLVLGGAAAGTLRALTI